MNIDDNISATSNKSDFSMRQLMQYQFIMSIVRTLPFVYIFYVIDFYGKINQYAEKFNEYKLVLLFFTGYLIFSIVFAYYFRDSKSVYKKQFAKDISGMVVGYLQMFVGVVAYFIMYLFLIEPTFHFSEHWKQAIGILAVYVFWFYALTFFVFAREQLINKTINPDKFKEFKLLLVIKRRSVIDILSKVKNRIVK